MENNEASLARTVTTMFPSKTVYDPTESTIHSHRRLILERRFTSVHWVSFPQKLNWNDTLQRDTRRFNAAFFSSNSSIFCCAIYGTNVQIERTWKDSPWAYFCCKTEIKTSHALSLRTNCMRKFRYQMNESSIDLFNCNQIPHVLTFIGTFCERLKLIYKFILKPIFFSQPQWFDREKRED